MDQAVYDMGSLSRQYNSFQPEQAACKVTFDGMFSLESSQIAVYDVTVNLSSESIAGSCSFKIGDVWRPASTDWDPKLLSNVKIGTPVTVFLGYIKKSEVFYGYVDSITYVYPTQGKEPYVQINALDALGFLMGVRDCVYAGENAIDVVVKKMLNACVSARAAKKASTGMIPVQDFPIQRIKSDMSNYEFLKILAEQTGRKFFAVKGEVMFEDVMSFGVPLFFSPIPYTVASDVGFYYVERSLCLDRQPSKVIVRGRDVDNNAIKAEVSTTTRVGAGRQASKAASSILQDAVYDEDSPLVRTQEDCKALAQTRFDMLAMNYVRVYAVCKGIPEIVPGRFLGISGIGRTCSDTYFITGVKHKFTRQSDSFTTEIEMRGATSL